jgi:hypothetical protein
MGLREELLRVEQEKMDIETEKSGNPSARLQCLVCPEPLFFFRRDKKHSG